jgi:pimeloyl-ACP methyl ester carboxylesterase
MGLGNLEGLLPDLRINGSGYAPINGIKMYYEIYGDSDQDLVLIHGGGSTIESCFGNAIPFFSDSHRLIALELQAHGHTSDREAPQSYEQDADDIAALMAYLGVEKASFFGFSNGGTAALQIGIRHPGLVDKLIILSAGFQREAFVDGFFDIFPNASIEKTFPEALKKAFLKVCPDQALLENMF